MRAKVLGLGVLLLGFGCGPPMGLPKEFGAAAGVLTGMVADQGLLDEFIGNIRGHVNEPGMAVFATIEFTSGVKIVGVDGDVSLQGSGVGTQLPAALRESLIARLDQPNLTEDQRAAILDLLGWRVPPSLRNPNGPG